MIFQNFKLASRRLRKNKSYTLINVIGLSVSLLVCLVILLYTNYHNSFDKYVNNHENSYRLVSRFGDGAYNANTFACFEEGLKEQKEIEDITVCYNQHNISEVFAGEKTYNIKELSFVDDSFFDFFGVKMIEGNTRKINQPNIVFLTPLMANKLFGHNSPIGETIQIRSLSRNKDGLIDYTVGGIVKSLPNASHIGYEMLVSKKGHFSPTIKTVKNGKMFAAASYVKLIPSANCDDILANVLTKAESQVGSRRGPPLSAFNFKFQPLTQIHFTADTVTEMRPTVRRSSLNILLIVGGIIFIMAIINFVNLYTASAVYKSKESGIIRYLGGKKRDLWNNMAAEVVIMLIFSFGVTFTILLVLNNQLSQAYFNNWQLSISSANFWSYFALLVLGSISLVLILTTLTSNRILFKSNFVNTSKKNMITIPLMVFQFALVIGLIGFTGILNKQVNFINDKPLGYSPENVMIINSPQRNHKVNVCRDELNKLPGVIQSGTAHHYPGYRLQDMNFSNNGNSFPFKFGMADIMAIKALNIETIKSFTPDIANATDGCLINETFYRNLQLKYTEEQISTSAFPADETDPNNNRQAFKIHGVISDFHYASLHNPIENFAFMIQGPKTNRNRFILIRYKQEDYNQIITGAQQIVADVFPGKPFEYSFLYDHMQQQYKSENTLMKLVNTFSLLSIIVACLGLLGMTIFMLEKRIKEIGIRKVNGAKVFEILAMLNKDFLKWITISFVVATPLAYFTMNKWLESFAYKTELSWWIFALAGLLAMSIALITVSWQSWRAATRNPVEALRYE